MMASRYGRGAAGFVDRGPSIEWTSHLTLDSREVAEAVRDLAVDKIVRNVQAGRGARGPFPALLDETIERYERDPNAARYKGGVRSTLQRSGNLVENIHAWINKWTPDKATVFFGVRGNPVYAYVQNALRKWMGLSRGDFVRVMNAALERANKTGKGLKAKKGPPPNRR